MAVNGRRLPLPAALVRRVVEAVLRGERRGAPISVTFLGRDAMRRLNAEHKGHDRPTDVLSFALSDPAGRPSATCTSAPWVAEREARARGIPVRQELIRLVVHGTLHALGRDHPEGDGRTGSPMWRRQERYVDAPHETGMMAMLQLFIAPLVAAALTLWSAWLALAAESDADLPRALGGEFSNESGAGTLSRNLHVAHLALLVLAGAAAGGAVAWWARSPAAGLLRLTLAVGLVWVLGDLLPRLLAAVAPELTGPARRAAAATLAPFRPLLRLAAWADTRARTAPAARARITPAPPSATCCSACSRWLTRPWRR